jgi:hypothetical protein
VDTTLVEDGKCTTDDNKKKALHIHSNILRMLVLQYELSRWLPERNEILEVTDGLCKAMKATHDYLSKHTGPKVSWRQYLVLSKATSSSDHAKDLEDFVVDIEFTWDNDSVNDTALASTRCLIQSMISLSWLLLHT